MCRSTTFATTGFRIHTYTHTSRKLAVQLLPPKVQYHHHGTPTAPSQRSNDTTPRRAKSSYPFTEMRHLTLLRPVLRTGVGFCIGSLYLSKPSIIHLDARVTTPAPFSKRPKESRSNPHPFQQVASGSIAGLVYAQRAHDHHSC